MDAAKKRIPEEALKKLILRHGYLEEREIQDCLDFQERLSDNSVKKSLEEIFVDSGFVPLEKSKQLLLFVEFLKIRWQGIAFCNIGLQKQKLAVSDMTFALITQRSVYLLKNKIISLEELLVRKSKISESDREVINSRLKELSLAEYEILLKESFSRMLKEDEKAYNWRVGVPPPSKLGKPKKKLTRKIQRLISERRKPKETSEKPSPDDEEIAPPKPSSRFVDFDIDHTELHEIPAARRHQLSSATVAVLLSAVVIFLIGVTVYLTSLLSDKDEVDAISEIRTLIKEKEYKEGEERCVEFREHRPASQYYREVTRYLQRIWLNDADTLYRQGKKQEKPKKLSQAHDIVPRILELNDETKEAREASLLLIKIEKTLKSLQTTRQFKQKRGEVRSLVKRKNCKEARKSLDKFKDWLQENGMEDEKFCRQCEQIISEQEERLRDTSYRYYPARELGKKVTPVDSSLPDGISMTILPLNLQENAKSVPRGCFFAIVHGYLCALNAENGKIIWVRYLGQSMSFYPIFIAGNREYYNMNLVDRVLVVSSLRNSLCLLDANTGKIEWEKELPEVVCVQPVLYKDKIYVGCLDHYCYRIGLTSGNLDGAYLSNGIFRHPPVFDRREENFYLYGKDSVCGYNLETGKRTVKIKTPGPLVAPVVAVSPYLYLFTENRNKTRIHPYLLTQKQPQLLKNAVDLPGRMQSPANLAGGTLAVATDTHLGIFCINPADYKKALFPLSKPLTLNDKSPALMRFSNVAGRLLVRRLLVAQEYLSVFQGFSNPTEEKFERIIHWGGKVNFKTYLPIQKCGSSFFWARISPTGDCLATCIKLDGEKCIPLWQRTLGGGSHAEPVMTSKGRMLVMNAQGDIYEIRADGKIPCHLLAKGAGEEKSSLLLIADEKEKVLSVGSKLRIFDTRGRQSDWEAKVTFQGELGQTTCNSENIFVGTARGVFVVSSRTGEENYEEFSRLPYRPFFGKPIFYRDSIAIGCDDGKLYLLKLETGPSPYLKKIGDVKTGGPVRSVPLLDGDVVYFGSHDGCMYAANLKTGENLWSFATQGHIVAKPVLHKGVLFFGSYDRQLYALSAQTGQLLWKRSLSGQIDTSPLIYRSRLYIMSIAGDLRAFDVGKGAELWQIPLGTPACSPVVMNDRIVLVGANGFVYFLKINEG